MSFEITYIIKEISDYMGKKNVIESNIKEEMVKWEISKSLSDKLLDKACVYAPQQLLVEYAEMQKRGLEIEIEHLDDLELTIKTKTDKIKESLESALTKQEEVFEEKKKEIYESVNKFREIVRENADQIQEIVEPVNQAKKTIDSLDSHALRSFFETVSDIIKISNNNPKLLSFIVENFKSVKD